MSPTIRIAITGGGLAGASLLHALLPYKHLDVHIFESAPAFKEAGMAVGVTRNALAALDLIGPSAANKHMSAIYLWAPMGFTVLLTKKPNPPLWGRRLISKTPASMALWVTGTYLMWNLLSHGQLLQFVVTGFDEHVESEWTRTVTADEIKRLYQHWPEHLRNAVVQLLCKHDQQPAYYLWEHPNTRTYEDGPVCVMGDAAHAMTPWQASGGGMSIEDSLVLSTLLGRSKSPSEAVTALKVYDNVRRPRTQRVVESCRKTGLMMSGVCEETKLDLGKLSQKLLPRWDFIMDLDMEQHRDEAVRMMAEELGKAC